MKANELRIGNKLLLNEETICNVLEIRNNYLRVNYIRKDNGLEHTSLVEDYRFEPIKLTDELILKCGGKKADENDSYGGIIIYYPNGNGMRIKNNEWSSNHISVKIEYLHQLQNIFFALTNQELKIIL